VHLDIGDPRGVVYRDRGQRTAGGIAGTSAFRISEFANDNPLSREANADQSEPDYEI